MYNHASEPIRFQRDCEAIIIPSGESVSLPAGTIGYLTQQLGGSFTVFVDGNLFRIAGPDADAIGKEPIAALTLAEGASDDDYERLVWEQMKTCFDPEIPVNIVDLGLIYECRVERDADGRRQLDIQMTLTAPGCGMGDILVEDVRSKLELIPTTGEVNVEMVFDPPWNPAMMTEAARLEVGLF